MLFDCYLLYGIELLPTFSTPVKTKVTKTEDQSKVKENPVVAVKREKIDDSNVCMHCIVWNNAADADALSLLVR